MESLVDRLREYASTRKGELAELITEAADALERQTCDDAVSRQQAIDAVLRAEALVRAYGYRYAADAVRELPAVQSEIIHCKECLHKIKNGNHYECNYWDFENPKDDGFCIFAERRTDEL